MDLSDDADDFDSFFSVAKSTKSNVKTRHPPDLMDDLFGTVEDDERQNKYMGNKLKWTATLKVPSISMDGDDDLGFDPKKPKGLIKSQDFFSDLLSPVTTNPKKSVKLLTSHQSSDITTTTGTEVSNVLQNPPASSGRFKTAASRHNSEMSNIYNTDPLGLFTKVETKAKDTEVLAPSHGSVLSIPKQHKPTGDWLGLLSETGTVKDEKSSTVAVHAESSSSGNLPKATSTPNSKGANTKVYDNSELLHDVSGDNEFSPEMINAKALASSPNKASVPIQVDAMTQNILLLGSLNKDAQQSYTTLKYQEHHLIMAQQMKQQEKNLMEMQQKQERLLQKQETQFNALLQQQLQRHQYLEEIITQQQQRLNNHLQMMMMTTANQAINDTIPPLDLGPTLITTTTTSTSTLAAEAETQRLSNYRAKDIGNAAEIENQMNLIQIQADSKCLKLENLRLEEMIANMKSNYEKEIEMLEKSHQKQVNVLEQQFLNMEQRLMREIENVEKHYKEKLDLMKTENENMKLQYDNQITDLKQEHEDEIRKLRRNHQDAVELIKEEHHRMLETIRQTKLLEFAVVQENGTNLETLKAAANNLTNLTDGLEELRVNVQHKIDVEQMEWQKRLDMREKHLEHSEKRLKLTEQMAIDEKKHLMELVAALETQLKKMSEDATEENWQLRQKMANLDAEKSVLNREKDYFREQMQRDEQRIKDLKDSQLMEIQKQQFEMQEERARLHVERAKFEMEKRLQCNNDHDKERLELEAALQVTQDATRKADMERERYHKMQRQLEQLKRDLTDREHNLNIKEEELHQELLSYRMAERVAQETQQKSKYTEQYYQSKIQLLQQRTQELTEKEAHLSQERLLLSQDRIALQALKAKLAQQTKCSLCQLTQKQQDISAALDNNLKSLDHNDILRLSNKSENNNNLLNAAFMMDNKNESFMSYASVMNQLQNNHDNNDNENNAIDINSNDINTNDVVERMLDANIAESLRKMQASTNNLGGWETLLDDDHKQFVQETSDRN